MRFRSRVLCVTAAPLLIGAVQPERLQPSSPWDVDYAANSCRLIRTFGEGKAETKLVFESPAPHVMDMLVVGKPLDTYDEQVPARFLPVGGKPFDGTVAQTVTKGDPAILWSNFPMLPPDAIAKAEQMSSKLSRDPHVRPPAISLADKAYLREAHEQFDAETTELEIDTHKNHPVILETGSLGPPMAALEKCNRDSLKDWGVDPDLEDKIVRPVWAINPTQWLFESDYPRDMLLQGKESDVTVRLLVDASGKVTKCTSLSHFDAPEFNAISCDEITKRARFEPAELADGTKVPSYYTRRINFRIAP